MNKDQLNQELQQWKQAEADTVAYLEYVRAQIHRVRVGIGALTVEQMRESGELNR